jgi:hypothetical protein
LWALLFGDDLLLGDIQMHLDKAILIGELEAVTDEVDKDLRNASLVSNYSP